MIQNNSGYSLSVSKEKTKVDMFEIVFHRTVLGEDPRTNTFYFTENQLKTLSEVLMK
jgi:hypothetical protein